MKCIYCNSEVELTSSDIITYAITGAKLTRPFVCKTHNSFTNDHYEKKFITDLDFFRNQLGLTTRNGKPIQYKTDLSMGGITLHNVKISNRESIFDPKDVIVGTDKNGNRSLLGPIEKIDKINEGKATKVDCSRVTCSTNVSADSFIGFYATHSVAKMAYEWYCYINGIEEFQPEYKDIVDYILGKTDGDFVGIIIDSSYYVAIDQLSEIGTNAFFQYDDIDGYRYVIFDFWKVIAYKVRICKSSNAPVLKIPFFIKLYHQCHLA